MTIPASASEQYALLHRLIEKGRNDEETWARLVLACIELERKDEALEAFARVTSSGVRRDLQDRLADRGWAEPIRRDEAHLALVTESDMKLSTREKLVAALQFLAEPQLRSAVVLGTIAFPVTLALGGLLTAAADSVPLRLLACLPPLLMVGMVGAFGRGVFRHALEAREDACELPAMQLFSRENLRRLGDVGALAGVLTTPAVATTLLGQPPLAALLLLLAAFVMPMALALRFSGAPWRSLAPGAVLDAVRRSPSYPSTAGAAMLLFTPAIGVFLLSTGKPFYILVSVVGPLSVAPFFVTMCMLGWTLHYDDPSFAERAEAAAAQNEARRRTAATDSPRPQPASPRRRARNEGGAGSRDAGARGAPDLPPPATNPALARGMPRQPARSG